MINDKSVLDFISEQDKEEKYLISLHDLRDDFKFPSIIITKKIQKKITEWVMKNAGVDKSCLNCRYEGEYPAYHCGKRCGVEMKAWKPDYSSCDDWMEYIAEYYPSILG